jgi:benzil reductase ((S)-benzoin forming)
VSRSIILTGTSRGLGAALFDALRHDGARLFALSRHFTDAQRAESARHPGDVILRETDLGDLARHPDPAELGAFLTPCADDDEVVLLHNAATIEPIGLVGTLGAAAVAAAVQVNLVAPMVLTDAFLSVVPLRLAARVVFITSGAAHRTYPGWAVYGATKAGAEAFMRTVDNAASRPCTVQVIDPGAMETSMQRTIRDHGDGLPGHDRLVQRHHQGEIPDPVDVTGWIMAKYFDTPATSVM